MGKGSKIKVTNSKQFEKLFSFMEENVDVANNHGKFGSAKYNTKKMWSRISSELNDIGPPTRSVHEWQRVWTHYKANLKRKLSKNRQRQKTTDGGLSEEILLTPLEKKVDEIISLTQNVNSTGKAFALTCTNPVEKLPPAPQFEFAENVQIEEEIEAPIPMVRSVQTKKLKNELLNLLKTQNKQQSNILKTLNKIEKSIYENCKINKEIKDIEAKKLKILEKNDEREEDLYKVDKEIKMRKLELLQLQIAK